MKCQKCVELGLKSIVYPSMGGISTCVAYETYYDEDGFYHNHDGNSRTYGGSCSNGHKWSTTSFGHCTAPGCKWNEGREPITRFET